MGVCTTTTTAAAASLSPDGRLTSEALLLAFERTGDACAFEELVRRHSPAVYAACLQVTGNAHDAEDAAQAVFLTLAVQARTTNGIESVGAWLGQVARNTSLDLIRARGRRKRREQGQAFREGPEAVHRRFAHPHPAQLAGLAEVKSLLREEIGKLPAKYRLPLILHYFGGMNSQDVSREMGCTPRTLAVRLFRARKLLGEQLRRRGVSVGGTMMSAVMADAILSGLAQAMREAGPASGTAASLAGKGAAAGPLASLLSGSVLRLIRTCALAAGAARLKIAIVLLLIVGTTLANTRAARQVLPDKLSPSEIVKSVLDRVNQSMSGLRQLFQSPIPRQISSAADNTSSGGGVRGTGGDQSPSTPVRFAWDSLPLPPAPRWVPQQVIADDLATTIRRAPELAPIEPSGSSSYRAVGQPITLTGPTMALESSWKPSAVPAPEMAIASADSLGHSSHAHSAASKALNLSGINGDAGLGGVVDSNYGSSPGNVFVASGGAGSSQSFGSQVSPEPTSAALLAAGAAALLLRRKRQRRRA
jgi:RNA polymerase sigma factor (sigma-70 family)